MPNSPMPLVTNPFVGKMAGFFFNDVRVFNLAVMGELNLKLYPTTALLS